MSARVAFFTPSYRGDFQRFRLLRKSITKFYQGESTHYVVVPKDDQRLFSELVEAGDRNLVVAVENAYLSRIYYPSTWYPIAARFLPAWRLHRYAGAPGWIKQQVLKLSADLVAPDDAFVVCDSDLVFLRAFGPGDLGLSPAARCLFRHDPKLESARSRGFMESARKLLQLPPGNTDYHYVNWATVLYSDWLKALRHYLEERHRRPWQAVLRYAEGLSEYCLYGVFVEEILRPERVRIQTAPTFYGIWDRDSYADLFAGDKLETALGGHLALVIQSNLGIPATDYEERLTDYLGLAA